MPNNDRDFREVSPHFDGTKEGAINDLTSSGGEMMGVRVDSDPLSPHQVKNPFHLTPKADSDMKEFQTIMEGEKPSI
ncbi:hypothetical protein [Priestia abyssalis]|uniref:hypothetical protein n=1 Tax=Priestia abyssalis TaxID=1221450 RepID=UPI000994A7D4|nr:hypothetical protein [Priestia abyssalis]